MRHPTHLVESRTRDCPFWGDPEFDPLDLGLFLGSFMGLPAARHLSSMANLYRMMGDVSRLHTLSPFLP